MRLVLPGTVALAAGRYNEGVMHQSQEWYINDEVELEIASKAATSVISTLVVEM